MPSNRVTPVNLPTQRFYAACVLRMTPFDRLPFKAMRFRILVPWVITLSALPVVALEIPYSNRGSDASLAPSGATYVVDLGEASTGDWEDAPATPGKGVYDPERWAVVFKYSSINIPAGTTVTFRNHPSRAPVVWLVDGDATVAGTVNLDGSDGDTDLSRFQFSEPGPGGFRGGETAMAGLSHSSGFGPGGGFRSSDQSNNRELSSASHATLGTAAAQPAPTYGNPLIRPLIGGSGGSGESLGELRSGGGAGGGALSLLVDGTLRLEGILRARGGTASSGAWIGSPSGSGGALRIAGQSVLGAGALDVRSKGSGGAGRILIESPDFQGTLQAFPSATFSAGTEIAVWPAASVATARVVSVSEVLAPTDPRAFMGPLGTADVMLPPGRRTNVVLIETRNLPPTASVSLRLTPRHGTATLHTAGYVAPGSDPGVELWTNRLVILPGYYALQVHATAP